ncbi:MAG: hypothetical protein ABSG57_01290 [Candidatus Bathyarchaeia archaeon]|jgi:hypothetical protein
MAEKPTAAFALSLIGAIFILLGGLAMLAIGAIAGTTFSLAGLGDFGFGFLAVGVIGLIWGIITLYGAIMMNSTDKSRVRTGAILVLVFSIISWFGTFGGFFIGFLLGLIGAILGLTWNPSTTESTGKPAPPVPP